MRALELGDMSLWNFRMISQRIYSEVSRMIELSSHWH